jgi:Aspartyl protease
VIADSLFSYQPTALLLFHSRRRLWKVIRILLAVVGLAAMAGEATAGDRACTLRRLAEVDLQIDDQGRVLIPVVLQGTSSVMYLDIGAHRTRLAPSAAQRLKLPTATSTTIVNITDDGRRLPAEIATVGWLSIGKAKWEKTQVLLYSPWHPPVAPAVSGTLGMDVLDGADFELDLSHRALRLYEHSDCSDAVVYWTSHFSSAHLYRDGSGGLFVPIELDGKSVEAAFSTYGPETSLMVDVTRRLYGFDEKSPGNEVRPASTGNTTVFFRAMKLTGEGLSATNVDVALVEPPTALHCTVRLRGGVASAAGYSDCGHHPMLLGSHILESLRLYFATKENVLYFSAAQAAGSAAPGGTP